MLCSSLGRATRPESVRELRPHFPDFPGGPDGSGPSRVFMRVVSGGAGFRCLPVEARGHCYRAARCYRRRASVLMSRTAGLVLRAARAVGGSRGCRDHGERSNYPPYAIATPHFSDALTASRLPLAAIEEKRSGQYHGRRSPRRTRVLRDEFPTPWATCSRLARRRASGTSRRVPALGKQSAAAGVGEGRVAERSGPARRAEVVE
jgi:hypothetical protein